MKLISTLSIALLCIFSQGHSAMNIGGTFNCLDSGAFMDISVTNTGVINGKCSQFKKIENHGKVNLTSCTVHEEVINFAELEAVETQFLKDVTVCSGEANFHRCHLGNLWIQDDNPDALPIVVLADGTEVNGTITFATGQGKVYVGTQTKIHGEVKGGTLLKLKKSPEK